MVRGKRIANPPDPEHDHEIEDKLSERFQKYSED